MGRGAPAPEGNRLLMGPGWKRPGSGSGRPQELHGNRDRGPVPGSPVAPAGDSGPEGGRWHPRCRGPSVGRARVASCRSDRDGPWRWGSRCFRLGPPALSRGRESGGTQLSLRSRVQTRWTERRAVWADRGGPSKRAFEQPLPPLPTYTPWVGDQDRRTWVGFRSWLPTASCVGPRFPVRPPGDTEGKGRAGSITTCQRAPCRARAGWQRAEPWSGPRCPGHTGGGHGPRGQSDRAALCPPSRGADKGRRLLASAWSPATLSALGKTRTQLERFSRASWHICALSVPLGWRLSDNRAH